MRKPGSGTTVGFEGITVGGNSEPPPSGLHLNNCRIDSWNPLLRRVGRHAALHPQEEKTPTMTYAPENAPAHVHTPKRPVTLLILQIFA
ncbi:hypothetical protein AB0I53_25505, partial [Saccharopolyspora sp. NPDC050389]|uniref:hypothetical protein n=1 Tax=Saccharopolyspora sp. NPDC050389 TaxID=3155516 RepID=UPI003408CB31